MSRFLQGATSNGGWVRFAAALERVEPAVDTLHGYLDQQRAGADAFTFRLLAFEGLSNAVRHGCCSDPARWVEATLEAEEHAAALAIADDGPGFDWQAHPAAPTGDRASHGRGLQIMHSYANEVRFNDAGNQVTIVMRLPPRRSPNERTEAPAAARRPGATRKGSS